MIIGVINQLMLSSIKCKKKEKYRDIDFVIPLISWTSNVSRKAAMHQQKSSKKKGVYVGFKCLYCVYVIDWCTTLIIIIY